MLANTWRGRLSTSARAAAHPSPFARVVQKITQVARAGELCVFFFVWFLTVSAVFDSLEFVMFELGDIFNFSEWMLDFFVSWSSFFWLAIGDDVGGFQICYDWLRASLPALSICIYKMCIMTRLTVTSDYQNNIKQHKNNTDQESALGQGTIKAAAKSLGVDFRAAMLLTAAWWISFPGEGKQLAEEMFWVCCFVGICWWMVRYVLFC